MIVDRVASSAARVTLWAAQRTRRKLKLAPWCGNCLCDFCRLSSYRRVPINKKNWSLQIDLRQGAAGGGRTEGEIRAGGSATATRRLSPPVRSLVGRGGGSMSLIWREAWTAASPMSGGALAETVCVSATMETSGQEFGGGNLLAGRCRGCSWCLGWRGVGRGLGYFGRAGLRGTLARVAGLGELVVGLDHRVGRRWRRGGVGSRLVLVVRVGASSSIPAVGARAFSGGLRPQRWRG